MIAGQYNYTTQMNPSVSLEMVQEWMQTKHEPWMEHLYVSGRLDSNVELLFERLMLSRTKIVEQQQPSQAHAKKDAKKCIVM